MSCRLSRGLGSFGTMHGKGLTRKIFCSFKNTAGTAVFSCIRSPMGLRLRGCRVCQRVFLKIRVIWFDAAENQSIPTDPPPALNSQCPPGLKSIDGGRGGGGVIKGKSTLYIYIYISYASCVCVYVYNSICIHTYIYIHLYTYIHTYICTYMHTDIYTYMLHTCLKKKV